MKKILLFVVTILSVVTLSACNAQVFDFNYEFEKVHLVSEHKCIEIKSWKNFDDSDMVQLTLKDDTVVLGHSNEIVLIKDNCPYCEGND